MPDETKPEDFDPVFAQGVVIVGGHAVNLWASYYASTGDAALAAFAPFTSKDADIFVRDKETARAIAAAAGWTFRNNPEPRSPVLGAIVLRRGHSELQIDVLRSITGLTAEDLNVTAQITFEDGRSYSVPAPDIMLKAKLANLEFHAQRDRQDERHVRILVKCCEHYLRATAEAAGRGDLEEREAVERFMATHRTIRGGKALDARHGLNLAAAIPAKETIARLSGTPRLMAFYAHQIERRRRPR